MTNKAGKLVALSGIPPEAPIDYDSDFGITAEIEWLVYGSMEGDDIANRASEVDIVMIAAVGKPPAFDLHMFPNLRAVLMFSAGYDVMSREMIPEGCFVTNTFEHEYSIADWVFMMMMILSRKVFAIEEAFRKQTLRPRMETGGAPLDMTESTLGVVGLGRIGAQIAKIASAHGVRCVVTMRTPISDQEAAKRGIDRVYPMDGLHEMLTECDFVVPAVPANDETTGLFGKAEYKSMKDSAYMINISRGEVLDEDSTYTALKENVIAGAALDVWWAEDEAGLATDDPERRKWSEKPFWELDNVFMSPHRSGFTTSMVSGKLKFIGAQINRLNRGEPLENIVTELSKG
jgi:phosphoglycerate dehydrogenase-like enzyme